MKILHLSKTPCAGAIEALSSAIRDFTPHDSRWIGTGTSMGMDFGADVSWEDTAQFPLLAEADAFVLHNYLSPNVQPLRDYLLGDPRKRVVGFYHSAPEACSLALTKTFPYACVAQYAYHTFKAAELDPFPIRNVIRFDQWDLPPRETEETIRIGFSPSNRNAQGKKGTQEWYGSKGFDETMAVLRTIEERPGVECHVIEDVSLQTCLLIKNQCDLLIDEVVTGSYHRSLLEGMALGRPTLTGMDVPHESLLCELAGLSELPKANDAPWVQVHASRQEACLLDLVADSDLRRHIGQRARRFMQEHWQPGVIAEEFCGWLLQAPEYGEVA